MLSVTHYVGGHVYLVLFLHFQIIASDIVCGTTPC